MSDSFLSFFVVSPTSADVNGEGSSFSGSGNSLTTTEFFHSCRSKKRVKKFAPLDDDEITLFLHEEITQCNESGECNLSKLQLSSVPSGLPLDFLAVIIISENYLTELPESMFEGTSCYNLIRFEAQSNKLTKIPKSLLTLIKLEVLLLDYNNIEYLPFDDISEKSNILPSLKLVGLELNPLKRFPVEFFTHCAFLKEISLVQNMSLVDTLLPTEKLRNSAVAQRLSGSVSTEDDCKVVLAIDNRPCFVKQIEEEKWRSIFSWLTINFYAIYPDKVLGFMYLGSARSASVKQVFRELNIGYVLTVAREVDVEIDAGVKHLVLPVEDSIEENIRPLLLKAFNFIDEARNSGKGVVVHCFAGVSRSVTVAAAYIMSRYNMTRDEALSVIKRVRPKAQPNPGFMETLAAFEEELREERNR